MIRLKDLCKQYDNGHLALNNISLNIEQGEIFGILGKSGAGKSTLLRCINLLERPTRGQVIIDETDLTSLTASNLRQQRHRIGFVFQHYNLLSSYNVFDNIALPLRIQNTPTDIINQKVANLLTLVDLTDKANSYPDQLSGGQKQRVGIARALSTNPAILLCDEATSALDSDSTNSILSLLKNINESLNITIVLITHELDVVKEICDRVAVIDHGKIVELSSTVALFSKPTSSIAKKLIQQALRLNQLTSNNNQSMLIKLTFIGDNSKDPLISTIAKRFEIDINIKQALIENIQETTVGFTVCELMGADRAIADAISYIQTTSVQVEVLNETT